MVKRCCNIDWLEVFCDDMHECTPEYFTNCGYKVKVREYGTPMYRQMFTLYQAEKPLYEIRRDPLSKKSLGGIFSDTICHIRFVNRICYAPSCVACLRDFLIKHGYHYRGISRIDICNDFVTFDNGTDPQKVIDNFMKNKISKINQCRVSAHGKDMFDGRSWNSLKWGSETSAVSTKLYNKTMELDREGHDKYYIRDAWQAQGLADTQWVSYTDKNGKERHKSVTVKYGTATDKIIPEEDAQKVNVWRVEFSIKTEGKRMINTDSGELLSIELSAIDTPARILFMFHVLSFHYFHFKKLVFNTNGKPQRKDRCPDIPLFRISPEEENFHPLRLTDNVEPDRVLKMLARKLDDIRQADLTEYREEEIYAADLLYKNIMWEASRHRLSIPPRCRLEDIDTYLAKMFSPEYLNRIKQYF